MGTVITGLIGLMLVIGTALTAVNTVLTTGSDRSSAIIADYELLIEDLETSFSVVSATTVSGSGSSQFDVVVTNDGRRGLGDFDDWDITVRYDHVGAPGETFAWLAHSDTLVDNTWITHSLWLDYADSQPELIEAGLLNIHEEVVLRIQLDPKFQMATPVVITVTAPTGYTCTTIFES
ncbi:MAG: hypothetical protein QF357_09460 [Dehalococcoidia bacterium]|jgi:hypothetical protein|nr:hypothetical protein [Dehalococcoidia bacterium]